MLVEALATKIIANPQPKLTYFSVDIQIYLKIKVPPAREETHMIALVPVNV